MLAFDRLRAVPDFAAPRQQFLGTVGELVERAREMVGEAFVVPERRLFTLDEYLREQQRRTMIRVPEALGPNQFVNHEGKVLKASLFGLEQPGEDETQTVGLSWFVLFDGLPLSDGFGANALEQVQEAGSHFVERFVVQAVRLGMGLRVQLHPGLT